MSSLFTWLIHLDSICNKRPPPFIHFMLICVQFHSVLFHTHAFVSTLIQLVTKNVLKYMLSSVETDLWYTTFVFFKKVLEGWILNSFYFIACSKFWPHHMVRTPVILNNPAFKPQYQNDFYIDLSQHANHQFLSAFKKIGLTCIIFFIRAPVIITNLKTG